MKKAVKISIAIIAAIIIVVIMVIFFLANRITMNPDGTVGNTAGNLNNSGLICEHNGTVYFSNPYDGGSLYAMNVDETNIRRLNAKKVKNILAGGKYIYYFQYGSAAETNFEGVLGMRTFNRCTLSGGNDSTLAKETVISAQLVNNYVYLLATSTSSSTGASFSKVKIDGSDRVDLGDFVINPACVQNNVIYYNGTSGNHYLYSLNTSTDVSREVWDGNIWNPVIEGDFVYFMNVSDNYRLYRYSMSQGITEMLTEDRVDCFNVGSGYIYYQKNDSTQPQLKFMRTDGTDVNVIAEGNYTNINMSSQYVYFQLFGNEGTMYHSRIGSGSSNIFSAASDAVVK